MKLKKTAILAVALLCLGAGIGGVFALTPKTGSGSYQGDLDKCINLYWKNGVTEVTPSPVKDLKANIPQYRYLSVEPAGSSTLNGTVTVNFNLVIDEGYNLAGLTIGVYSIQSSLVDKDTDFAAYLATTPNPPAALFTLSPAKLTDDAELTIVNGAGSAYYGMVFTYDGAKIEDVNKWGGVLKINQSFIEAA